jgi:hypothetical protein
MGAPRGVVAAITGREHHTAHGGAQRAEVELVEIRARRMGDGGRRRTGRLAGQGGHGDDSSGSCGDAADRRGSPTVRHPARDISATRRSSVVGR